MTKMRTYMESPFLLLTFLLTRKSNFLGRAWITGIHLFDHSLIKMQFLPASSHLLVWHSEYRLHVYLGMGIMCLKIFNLQYKTAKRFILLVHKYSFLSKKAVNGRNWLTTDVGT